MLGHINLHNSNKLLTFIYSIEFEKKYSKHLLISIIYIFFSKYIDNEFYLIMDKVIETSGALLKTSEFTLKQFLTLSLKGLKLAKNRVKIGDFDQNKVVRITFFF